MRVSAKMFLTEDSLNIKYLHSKQLYISGEYLEAIQELEVQSNSQERYSP
jgi:hypothetical protein